MNKVQIPKTSSRENITPEQATALLVDSVQRPASERLNLADCQQRLLAERIVATLNIPNFAKSPYDGYAVRHEDVVAASAENPIWLHVVDDILVGQMPAVDVVTGQCAKIATGAMLPVGADCIVPFERVLVNDTNIQITQPIHRGANVIPIGDDIEAGQTLS